MKIWQALKEAIASLAANKTRSFLTVLGIVIGVGAVIGVLSIGQGAEASIIGQIESIGTNVIYVFQGNRAEDVTNPNRLTTADADALSNRARAPHILNIAPVLSGQSRVRFGDESVQTSIMGVVENYAEVTDLKLSEGTFFTESNVTNRSSVVVLGPELAERLTGRKTELIGTTVHINNYPFRVVGIATAKGGNQFSSPDMDAYIPITAMQLRVQRQSVPNAVDFLLIQAQDSQSIDQAMQEAKTILRASHRLTSRQPDDFTMTNQEDVLSIANSITKILTVFLAGIAAISLLVGGIGIMNIMLVSVTERTREIGLRKALGARKFDIQLQFLTESAMLSVFGGLIGIGLGWLLGKVVGLIAANSGTPLVPEISLNSVLLATLFSLAVGVFFGWYPALRAANLEPVEALRYE
jgi:putative ABC transport system permease protein